jgi:hypothetical protein
VRALHASSLGSFQALPRKLPATKQKKGRAGELAQMHVVFSFFFPWPGPWPLFSAGGAQNLLKKAITFVFKNKTRKSQKIAKGR